jgi:LacI family transcriptional regulator
MPNPAHVTSGEYGDNTGYNAMQVLLRTDPRPDGVFCYNDPVAAGAIKAILEANLRVPEDIAIIGAGNVHYSDLLRVPLSTVDQNSTVIGETATELLVNSMDSRKQSAPRHVFIPPRLVVRDSSRRKE